jgi:hypothetical protein
MLHIKIRDRAFIDSSIDPMGRDWIGYHPSLSVEELFENNRGRWFLGQRADREKYAVFSYTGDHKVKFVAEIEGFEPSGDKRVIVGRVLEPDHPLSKRWVGAAAPDHFRNPSTYFKDSGERTTCACGCGEPVRAGRVFVPGHDQKAIHARITKQWGGPVGFIDWFDATYPEQPT